MRFLLAVNLMGAVEDEGTFWTQLLMLVVLGAGAGVYLLVKSRTKRAKQETHDEIIETIITPAKSALQIPVTPPPVQSERRRIEWPAADEIKPHRKDLKSGMELLARNFLVSVVERTDSPDRRDIEMRCLCFNELSRRGELWSIESTALKVYTLDEDGFYGKTIRCEAMAELAGRTRPGKEAAENAEPAEEPSRDRTANEALTISKIPSA